MRTCLILVAALGTAILSPVGEARAEEGESYKGWQVSKLQIRGVPKDLANNLQNGLVLSGESKLFHRKYPVFYPETLEEDLGRVRLYLARNGYPEARVTTLLDPHPLQRKLKVTLEVDTGPAARIDSVILEGVPDNLIRHTRRKLTLTEGSLFVDEELTKSVQVVGKMLQDAGYANVEVKARVEPEETDGVTVVLAATLNDRHVFGQTHVEGVSEDLVPLTVRAIDLDPGDMYSAEGLKRARENLRLLGLFRQIRLGTVEAAPGTLDVKAKLSEREPRTVNARVGWWSQDQLRTQASWQNRNTFGGGRGLKFLAAYSQFLAEGGVSTWWPALIGPRTREVLELSVNAETEDAFTQVGAAVSVATWYRQSFRTTYKISVAVGYVAVDEPGGPEGEFDDQGWLTPITGSWNWDTSDDRINPNRGTVTWLTTEWSPPPISANRYIRGEAGNSVYVPLPRKSVLAFRFVLGLGEPLGETTSLIPGKRFFAGGVSSNRGFERRRLGPLDANDDPVGGEAKFETMLEVRVPLFWKLRAAAFLDVGQVWTDVAAMRLDSLEPSAGPALMIDSPVGPIRFDYGIRLRDPGNEKREVFHFTIGHPF